MSRIFGGACAGRTMVRWRSSSKMVGSIGIKVKTESTIEAKRMPRKHGKYAYHYIQSLEQRRDGLGFVRKLQIIDRILRPALYRKLVIDADTGALIRDEDKPLADHHGHGSARPKLR